MSYYKICPECGAHLDPGESCDCSYGYAANVGSPFSFVPCIGVTMTNEREREIERRYGVTTDIRKKAREDGLFLRKVGAAWHLQTLQGYKTVAKFAGLSEVNKWLDEKGWGRNG